MRIPRVLSLAAAGALLLGTRRMRRQHPWKTSPPSGSSGGGDKGTVVGGWDFTESQIGGDLPPEAAGERRLPADQASSPPGRPSPLELSRARVDIVPDYPRASPTTSTPRRTGPTLPWCPSHDPDATKALGPGRGRGHLDPAAVGRDRPERLFVTQDFAEQNA